MANSWDPEQTAPIGAVCSGSTLFASILNSSVMLGNYLQQKTFSDAFFSWWFLRVKNIQLAWHGWPVYIKFYSHQHYENPSKHTDMGPIWGVQPGSAWVPYGLAHMRVAQMGPISMEPGSTAHMGPIKIAGFRSFRRWVVSAVGRFGLI